MKKIVCELCDGTDFTKEGGFFVCHGCGTRYSLEEAKSLMKEIEVESAPMGSTAPFVSVQVGNTNQSQIDNLLLLATNAYEAKNYAEAENYCNKAIELDAMCFKAWNLKGKAIGWQSKIDNLRIEEAAHSFCKAIDFAPEDEKEELKTQASEELKKLGLALISIRKQRFSRKPDSTELNGFTNDKKVLMNALLVLLSHGNAVGIPEGYLDEVATMMNDAAEAATKMAQVAWKKLEHPSDKDLMTYIGWMSNIIKLFALAIDTSKTDDEADIKRYYNLIDAIEDPIGKSSYKKEWSSYQRKYVWVKSQELTPESVSTRRNQIKKYREKVEALEKAVREKKKAEREKAAEEKQARIEAYWTAHVDEKVALEEEKKQLLERKGDIKIEISDLNAQITANVPAEDEIDGIQTQIQEIESRKAKLGVFAGKEKKQLSEQISSLRGRIETLKNRAQTEHSERDAPFESKRSELNDELVKAIQRIKAIETELTKDPEE